MKKILLLLTLTFGLTTFGFSTNNTSFELKSFDEFGNCNYSITTVYSDGSTSTENYSTTAYNQEHCEYIAENHALQERLTK